MKKILFAILVFISGTVQATPYTVTGIKVSVTADSAGKAREDALQQGHVLAYQKLVTQLQSEGQPVREDVPPPEELMGMVKDFSIDREKNTAVSYTASLSFQFDPDRLNAWISRTTARAGVHHAAGSETPGEFTVFVPITDLSDLQKKQNHLKQIAKTDSITLKTLTPLGALLVIKTHLSRKDLEAQTQNVVPLVIQTSQGSTP